MPPPAFAANKKAGMTSAFFREWVAHVKRYWPDSEDNPGHRVILKADSGPGRFDEQFLVDARRDGVLFFPGLPNGSEITQEADQLIAAIKAGVYRNRDKLYAAQCKAGYQNPDIRNEDLAKLLLGGKVRIRGGAIVELENAYLNGLTHEKIESACDKCGYKPSTHAALLHDKVRVSIGADETEDELCQDPYTELCLD